MKFKNVMIVMESKKECYKCRFTWETSQLRDLTFTNKRFGIDKYSSFLAFIHIESLVSFFALSLSLSSYLGCIKLLCNTPYSLCNT